MRTLTKMKYLVIAIVILTPIFGNSIVAQGSPMWKTLGMIEKVSRYDESIGMQIDDITVGMIPKAYQGKEIEIDGYIIPLTGKVSQNHFMLSLYPANMCFFCGAAGPETAMQVFMSNDKKVKYSDNKIRLKGVLRINEQSANGLLYTLEEAVLL